MNNYQETLNRLKGETIPNPYTENHNGEDFGILQELIVLNESLKK